MRALISYLFFTIFQLSSGAQLNDTGYYRCTLTTQSVIGRTVRVEITGSECSPQIHTERNTKYNESVGESLAIQCPVSFCSKELPVVSWCKFVGETCESLSAGPGRLMEWTGRKENTAVYLLTFVGAQLNDTGYYRCTLTTQSVNTVGRTVMVKITGHKERTTAQLPSTTHTRGGCSGVEGSTRLGYWVILLRILIVIGASSLLFYCLGTITANRRFSKTLRRENVTGINASKTPPISAVEPPLDIGSLHTPGPASANEITYNNITAEETCSSVEDSNDKEQNQTA
ncbi:hypothetical protein XENTR_v10004759 [Xenopus tropicalis]|nr:hypothetical protein XENTR_v10004759 [Xenopus tropicalis]